MSKTVRLFALAAGLSAAASTGALAQAQMTPNQVVQNLYETVSTR